MSKFFDNAKHLPFHSETACQSGRKMVVFSQTIRRAMEKDGNTMTKRKEINDKVVEWIINKVKTEYADDVSLVLLYGSYINGTANSKSDVDCYYIPKTEHGYHLATGFIIDGVGYDLFPISWERITQIADLQECLLPLVGDVQVIYCGNSRDLERFKEIQCRLHSNLANDEYVKAIARKRCEDANTMCEQIRPGGSLSEIRKIAGHVIMTLADVIAIFNHDYFHFGLKKQYENLASHFPDVPQHIVTGYRQVVISLSKNDVIEKTISLLKNVCDYVQYTPESHVAMISNEVTVAVEVNASWLAGLYEEISSTFRKIYVCCESGNYILAFLSAVCLQRELDDAKEAGSPSYDLLSSFDYRDLGKLAEKTRMIEADFVELITGSGGNIKSYDNWEAFIQADL